ncbi:MAG: glycosyltransferase [Candidatus Levybacteria bacterium]|nr:glycosyltransferase [Candidatus Levybacteria bacterium]
MTISQKKLKILVMKDKMVNIHIIALAALGGGISGGDRIFIELARRWSKTVTVNLYVWEEGKLMCQRENLSGKFLKINLVKVGNFSKLGFILTYFYRIFLGIALGVKLKMKDGTYVYSASEFWMDFIPAFLLKLRYPKIKWVAAWFQTAPNPLTGFTEGKRKDSYRLSAFLYWFTQQLAKPFISGFADLVLVNNELEKKQFSGSTEHNRIIVLQGAVNIQAISEYLNMHKSPKIKKYLAVFQGRFHPQKGVVELIDIWKSVIQKIPSARLAMIGDGPLMSKVKKRIRELNLENSVDLYGYLHDGGKKYSVFNNSMIIVHPSFYDSGGMAPAEGMAFGMPCIGFNLESFRHYYPAGMLKVPVGDINAFSGAILMLTKNKEKYQKISKEAKEAVEKEWSWDDRAKKLLDDITSI